MGYMREAKHLARSGGFINNLKGAQKEAFEREG
jgi:hypothetical protein